MCRICPGLHFAKAMLFALISNVLHTFWISLPEDENGEPVPLSIKMTPGVISCVLLLSLVISHVAQLTGDCPDMPNPSSAASSLGPLRQKPSFVLVSER